MGSDYDGATTSSTVNSDRWFNTIANKVSGVGFFTLTETQF